MDSLFPFDEMRKEQDELIRAVEHAVNNETNSILHTPTDLGKTIANQVFSMMLS